MTHTRHKTSACGVSAPQAGLPPVLRLIIGIALILGFIFGVGSLSQFIPGARRMGEIIDARDLRATAIFYTDFEASAQGSEYIRDRLDYPTAAK